MLNCLIPLIVHGLPLFDLNGVITRGFYGCVWLPVVVVWFAVFDFAYLLYVCACLLGMLSSGLT